MVTKIGSAKSVSKVSSAKAVKTVGSTKKVSSVASAKSVKSVGQTKNVGTVASTKAVAAAPAKNDILEKVKAALLNVVELLSKSK